MQIFIAPKKTTYIKTHVNTLTDFNGKKKFDREIKIRILAVEIIRTNDFSNHPNGDGGTFRTSTTTGNFMRSYASLILNEKT